MPPFFTNGIPQHVSQALFDPEALKVLTSGNFATNSRVLAALERLKADVAAGNPDLMAARAAFGHSDDTPIQSFFGEWGGLDSTIQDPGPVQPPSDSLPGDSLPGGNMSNPPPPGDIRGGIPFGVGGPTTNAALPSRVEGFRGPSTFNNKPQVDALNTRRMGRRIKDPRTGLLENF